MKMTLVFLLLSVFLTDTTDIKLKPEASSIKVLGTSSIHDWTSDVEKFSVKGKLFENVISNLEVQVNTRSIKSGKSAMDEKTYEALKADKHPEIRFKADQLKITGEKIKGKGSLTLVGKSELIDIEADILSRNGNQIQLQGTVRIKMSDFGVEPPTAMFGSIRTGDEVSIKYDILIINN